MRWMWGLMLLFVAACGKPAEEAADVGDLNAIATAGPTVAEVLARGDDRVAAEAPSAAFDQSGAWAATRALCARDSWRFTARGARTADGTACTTRSGQDVSATSKRLELRCTSEGIAAIENWALNLHEDGSMTVSRTEGGNGVPRSVTLRRCV